MSILGPISTLSPYSGGATLDLDFTTGESFSDLFTYSRAGTATYVDADGIVRTAAVDEPRIDYDPVTGRCNGLLLEGTGTNILSKSYYKAGDSWVSSRISLAENVGVAPNGTNTLSHAIVDDVSNIATTRPDNAVSYEAGKKYRYSCWFKLDPALINRRVGLRLPSAAFDTNRYVFLDVATGEVSGTGSPEDFGAVPFPNGYRLVWITHTATSTVSTVGPVLTISVTGDVSVGDRFGFWGMDLRDVDRASSHIPTLGAPETRARDDVVAPVSLSMEGLSFYCEAFSNGPFSGVANDRRHIFSLNGSGSINFNVFISGLGVVLVFGTGSGQQTSIARNFSPAPGQRIRVAGVITSTGVRISVNGSAVNTIGPVVLVGEATTLMLGQQHDRGLYRQLEGCLQRVSFWQRPLADDQLIRMSTI